VKPTVSPAGPGRQSAGSWCRRLGRRRRRTE
jgi:hypothetical protein